MGLASRIEGEWLDESRREAERHRREMAIMVAGVSALREACAPFLRVAAGIPPNWPGGCVLTFDEYPSGTRALNYLREADNPDGPTIDDWRRLAAAWDAWESKSNTGG